MGKKKQTKRPATSAKEEEAPAALADDGKKATGAVSNYAPPKYDENERNVRLDRLDINYHGNHILRETTLSLIQGRRYGVIGPNGCGKSTLLNVIGAGELELPPKLDYFHLSHEVEGTDDSALECVMKVDSEKIRLEEELAELEEDPSADSSDRMDAILMRLDELEAETAEARASRILHGLGFDKAMQQRPCKSYSGGWRMRIALAQVLFLRPSMMILDEPTNHLDIEAVVWLENYLKTFKGILLMVSHSQDFMNSICTNIIHLCGGKMQYYAGNYDQYYITREEKEENQEKRRQWEQGQMKSMKDYIARFGHGSRKLARQAQSKEKTLAKMVRGGLTEAISRDRQVSFAFPDPGYLPPPIIKFEDVSFRYPSMDHDLYVELDFGIDLDSHICLVGPNGAGKTTLQKLITGELEPTKGYVQRNGHCVVARFNQHFVDQLDMELSPLDYMKQEFPEAEGSPEKVRSWVGRFGITGASQTAKIGTLSDGMKSRVVLAWMAQRGPHILLLDEPTNHLDMDSIDALAEALNEFEGGVILVSHDMRLIAQASSEIWICDDNRVKKVRAHTPPPHPPPSFLTALLPSLPHTVQGRHCGLQGGDRAACGRGRGCLQQEGQKRAQRQEGCRQQQNHRAEEREEGAEPEGARQGHVPGGGPEGAEAAAGNVPAEGDAEEGGGRGAGYRAGRVLPRGRVCAGVGRGCRRGVWSAARPRAPDRLAHLQVQRQTCDQVCSGNAGGKWPCVFIVHTVTQHATGKSTPARWVRWPSPPLSWSSPSRPSLSRAGTLDGLLPLP